MEEVIRREYLNRLLSGKDRPETVKIITGMRRCGKTTLMKQYIGLLKDNGVPDSQIIHLNFESKNLAHVSNYMELLNEIDKTYNGKRTYIFLDEVQMVNHWERAINSLQTDYDADIYVTGSNAYLLSSDLSTYISGRYAELPMLPLSFSEFMELYPGDRNVRFQQYIRSGSLPVIDPEADEMFEHDHLIGIFNTILMKDVLKNCRGGDAGTLTDIVRFLYSNIGNITSANKIATTIKKDPEKVRNYLDALKSAYLIYKAERYDIRGKKLLDSLEKYYVTDTGMRNAVLGISSKEDISRQIENIVYLELIRRGYEVSVGKYGDKEVDFTARRGNEIEYIQVAMTMLPENTYEREIGSLKAIRDSHPKTVLSMDSFVTELPDGLKHYNLLDWLTGTY
ncbi:MAG: ATP-binding protein [Candidatus Methanomethylophilaceae archaeon]|nr:ATP-binding protein [Candidatus Methanomethylophilaceae archaeon]